MSDFTSRMPRPSRRQFLLGLFGGASALGLRSLATGLPIPFLASRAMADPLAVSPVILSLRQSGDPLNANCPGSYVAGVTNNPAFGPGVELMLGSQKTRAAQPWADLPAAVRAKLAFLHHSTQAVAHPDFPKVLALQGAGKGADGNGSEMLPSLLAQELAPLLGTVQAEPVDVGGTALTALGNPLPSYTPASLKGLFAGGSSLDKFAALRDGTLDALYKDLRSGGTPAQRRFLDANALARQQAASLGAQLGELLAMIPPEGADGSDFAAQVVAAVALVKTRVTPVVTIALPFGGDNHNDPMLALEAEQTTLSVAAIGDLHGQLEALGLNAGASGVTFASLHTFGRTLSAKDGRAHNGAHHVMALFGPRVRAGVYGGLGPDGKGGKDPVAQDLDAASGRAQPGGDIPVDQSLAAAAATLCAAAGLPADRIARRVKSGRVVQGTLVG